MNISQEQFKNSVELIEKSSRILSVTKMDEEENTKTKLVIKIVSFKK